MLIVFLLAVAAVALAIARGGSLEALAETKLRWVWLLIAGLALQSAFMLWTPAWATGARWLFVVLIANLAVVVFIALNRRMSGMLLADVGVALNLLVIVLNGAMPVSVHAARVAGIERSPDATGPSHEAMDDGTALPWLGDVIPVPQMREVWSAGDLILAAGIARLVYVRTLSQRQGAVNSRRASGLSPEAGPEPRRSRRRRRRAPTL